MQKIAYEDLKQTQMAGGCSTTYIYECGGDHGGPPSSSSGGGGGPI